MLPLKVTPKRWYTPFMHVFVLFLRLPFFFLSFFLLVTEKDEKTCFNRGTNDLDQQMACGAPVRWLKYTTLPFEPGNSRKLGMKCLLNIKSQSVSKYSSLDLALIKLVKTVAFRVEPSILPICLPTNTISLHNQKAYVAGWGRTRNDDCFTDNYGPERHTKCRYI